jgi:hypothetical protein
LQNFTGILDRLEDPVDDATMVMDVSVEGAPKRWMKLTAPKCASGPASLLRGRWPTLGVGFANLQSSKEIA